MARSFKKISTISAVTAGALCTITLPLGATYDQVMIKHTGVTLNQMKNIRVNVNTDMIQEYKNGTVLNNLNKYYQREVEAGTLDFHFKQPEMKTLGEKRYYCLGTQNAVPQTPDQIALMPAVTSLTITFEIDSAANAPKIECYAIQSDAVPLGQIIKVKRYPTSLNAGTNEIDNIPKNFDARIKAIHVHTQAEIEKITVIVDGTEVFDFPQSLIEKVQKAHDRTPQAGVYTQDFTYEGAMLEALPLTGVRDLRLRVECKNDTSPATYAENVIEYIDTLKGA